MEELKYLVEIVNRDKVKKIEVIGNSPKKKSKLNLLYTTLLEGNITDESEVAEFLYPGASNQQKKFSNLKGQLRDRLINTVFFIDIKKPNFKEIHKAYFTCYKNTAAVQILIGRYARTPAISIAQKTLKKSIEFEFTDINLELSRLLRSHYGTIIGDKKKFNEYNNLVKKFESNYQAELLAEEYYIDLISESANIKGYKESTILKAKGYFEKLISYNKDHHTNKFKFYAYLVIVARFELENDYRSILKYSTEAIEELSKNVEIIPPNRIAPFILRKLVSQLHLKNYEEANKGIQEYLSFVIEGTRNWYIALTYRLKLAILTMDYQEAYHTYKLAITHQGFRQQQSNITEAWKINEAFIFYFIYSGKIVPDQQNPTKKFRINKFLNDVPLYSKDKRGYNISILILQILFLLHQKKYEEIIDRMESIKMYEHRYLKNDASFRSSCFIKMLLQLSNASFHKVAVLRKTEKWRKRLEEKPIELVNQSAELEIVPYEQLWDLVLEELDERFH